MSAWISGSARGARSASRRRWLLAPFGLGLALAAPFACWATEVVAVLSSDLAPYRLALAGFREAHGRPVDEFTLAHGPPALGAGTRVVVTFGGRAALQSYSDGVVLVVCLAPGTQVDRDARPTVVVHMLPEPAMAAARLAELQPSLRRLGVLWVSEGLSPEVREIVRAGERLGIETEAERLPDGDALPDRLRALSMQHVEALWLLNDPLLVNARNFSLLREFSWANDIPFYVPNQGLVEQGAVASVSAGFGDSGRAAARAVADVLAGSPAPPDVWPTRCEVTVNLTAAANAGLRIPQATLKKADKVLP